ncbi:MAG: DUF4292 domain-containing protein [Deltaproteobacteria bacterium]|nr:DUF4292 domain-containing protein [Deltaproteobacteria bacterium]
MSGVRDGGRAEVRRPRTARGLGLGGLPAILALAGCPVPPPANAIEDGPAMEARLAAVLAAVGDVRAETRVEQVTERGPVKGAVYVFLRAPDRLRFDAMSMVDTPLAVLVSDGTDFALHDVGGNRYYFGAAEPCNIARLLRIPLGGDAVVRILLGLPPATGAARSSVVWDGDGFYVYRQESDDGLVLEAHVAPLGEELDTLLVRLSDGSGTVWEATFDGHRERGGVRLPSHVRFSAREGDGPVEVWYGELEPGVELPDDAWSYPPPYGIPAEPVTCETVIDPVRWGTQE